MEREKGVAAQLEVGRPGQFDVLVDGAVIFSKAEAGRFPEHEEILGKL
ncbi:MAG: Rdx family protein [Polyangiaceae bacterium]|nr:Rdx family protein [Polyangiaceae bacterium]